MRVLFLLIVVVALLAFAGWLTFSAGPGRTSVNLEKHEIREDTHQIMRSGAEILDKASDGLQPSNDTARPAEREANRPTTDLE